MVSHARSTYVHRSDQRRLPDDAGAGKFALVVRFDASCDASWSELIRAIVATANSGGGIVLVQWDDGARAVSDQLSITAEVVTDHLARFIDSPFDDITVRVPAAASGGVEIFVGPAEFPIGLSKEVSAAIVDGLEGKEATFGAGQFYFRHGNQVAVGTSADLRAFFARKLRQLQHQWLRDIRQAFARAVGSSGDADVALNDSWIDGEESESDNLQPVRIVEDPSAPALQPQHVDRLYPWRQRDLVDELNRRLGRRELTTYDVQAVRRQHDLDARPDFVFHLPGAGRRYSPAIADWLMAQYAIDPEFFRKAHAADQAMLRLRRKRPR
jgi:hypothetical protein